MCLQCLPINKNHDRQLNDSKETKNKEVDGEEYEKASNKRF